MTHIPDIKVMADVPRYHGTTRPNDVALVFEDRVTNYADFEAHTSKVANGLISEGIKPQTRIGFLGKNSDHYFELLYGCAKANAVMVGVNWRLAPPEVEYIFNDAEAEILFIGSEFYSLVDQIKDKLTFARKIVAMDGAHEDWQLYEQWRDNQSDSDPKLSIGRDEVAVQMYTSGTTGRPKGAMITNQGFMAGFEADKDNAAGEWNMWSANDVTLVAMPVFHIGGTGWGHQGLYQGAKNIVLSEFTPDGVLDSIRDFGITKIFMVPAAMQFVLQNPRSRETDYSTIKYILYGASPIPLDLLREAIEVFKCGFVQLYGMTEMTGTVVYLPPEDHSVEGNEKMRSAGVPMPGVEICIMDENSNTLAPGEIGEICVKGPMAMKGYWNMPEASAKTIPEDGWLRSGDAGFMDRDGYVYVHDRVKDMIVSGGENVYPAEVESAIFGHDSVADVAVIGVPSERWGEEVKAVVVLKEGHDVSEDDIIGFSRERIAAFKAPKSVDFIEALPRNPSGKILKKDLRAPYWEGKERMVN